MKRLNPNTDSPFRRGETREDGFVFFAYTNKLKRNGHFVEIWLRPEASERALVNDRQRHRQKAHGNRRRHSRPDA